MENEKEIKELSSKLVRLGKKLNMLYERFDSGIALSEELSRRYKESTNADEKKQLLKEQSRSREENANTLRMLEWAREDIGKVEAAIARIKKGGRIWSSDR